MSRRAVPSGHDAGGPLMPTPTSPPAATNNEGGWLDDGVPIPLGAKRCARAVPPFKRRPAPLAAVSLGGRSAAARDHASTAQGQTLSVRPRRLPRRERFEGRGRHLGIWVLPKPAESRRCELDLREAGSGLGSEPLDPSTRSPGEPVVSTPRQDVRRSGGVAATSGSVRGFSACAGGQALRHKGLQPKRRAR